MIKVVEQVSKASGAISFFVDYDEGEAATAELYRIVAEDTTLKRSNAPGMTTCEVRSSLVLDGPPHTFVALPSEETEDYLTISFEVVPAGKV